MSLEEPLLTATDLAELLQVSVACIYGWRFNGTYGPPFLKVGNRLRYRREDVEEWLGNQEQKTSPQKFN